MSSAAPQPRPQGSRARVSRIAESAVARARLSVVPRTRATSRRMPFLALVTLLLVGGVVGLLLFNTSMQQASFAATGLEDQATALTAREQSLTMDLEKLRDPQRLAEQAQRMGMVLPSTWCTVRLGAQSPACTADAASNEAPLRLRPLPPVKPRSIDPHPIVVHPPASGHDTAAASPAGGGARGRNGHNHQTGTAGHQHHRR